MHLPAAALPSASALLLDPAGRVIADRVFGPRSAFWAPQQLLNMPQEGLFTPTIIGQTTAGTGTYTIQTGTYTKVGSLVFFQVELSWTAHTGTGNMRVAGLPFPANNTANAFSAITVGFMNNVTQTANNVATAYLPPGTTEVVLAQYPVGGGAASSIAMDTAATIVIGGCYRA